MEIDASSSVKGKSSFLEQSSSERLAAVNTLGEDLSTAIKSVRKTLGARLKDLTCQNGEDSNCLENQGHGTPK